MAAARTDSTPYGSVLIGDIVYFTADDGVHGRELWRTDGTAAGTRLVRDLDPGSPSSSPCALTDVAGTLYFGANDSTTSEYVLWRSDGTTDGTVALQRFPATGGSCLDLNGYAGPRGFTPFGGRVFFSAADAEHGNELWVTDGTPGGTAFFKDINPGGEGCGTDSLPHSLLAFRGELFFLAARCGGDLWRSDGTADGTVLLRSDDPDESWRPAFDTNLLIAGETLVFVADHNGLGYELWGSDGTAAGTVLLKDTAPGPASGLDQNPYDGGFAAAAGRLFFFALTGAESGDPDSGPPFRIWQTDGTAAGTVPLGSVADGPPPRAFAVLGDTLYFAYPRFHGSGGLWKVTSAGVEPVATLSDEFGAEIGGLVASNRRLFLLARDQNECALWTSDGTAGGTSRLRNGAGCFGGMRDEDVVWLQPYPGGVLFGAIDPVAGYELFRSDGTAEGTVMVADINQTGGMCTGDCDGDGHVTVAELVRAVGIALGNGAVSSCAAADVDGDRAVTVNELIGAVNRALTGC